jgi:TP901 family phage tail tape measure protein
MAAINVSVGGNTRQLERDIQKTVNKSYNINLKTKVGQPLGRITGQVDEFNKSLAASNARVIAFGASAGIIFGVQRALGAVASSAIEVQKSLQDINVILNVSASQLNKFGSELFNIAKNTGQSFGEVAKAATEFSRQGLGVEETLKRTNQALILSRLSGLDAAKSVQSLTAAVNSYAAQAVTASEVVNKFANVDAAFAVSSADLADALGRVGSSAAQSGVSLNELIAIVTAAQQTTARGGAVIGNSFKTIFTRLQRGKVVDLLENLGISSTDSTGQIKSTIQLLQDLAKTYDQLGTLQQAEVAEKVGGVFQINILKAALADLGKEYSIYNSALDVAASTTDQAIRRNEELNKTYSAQINALKENAKQLASNAGERLIGPTFERVVGGANQILGGINNNEGNDYGSVLGKGILDGLAQVIAGPGLALLGGIFAKLFADLSRFAIGSAKDFLGLNNAAKQQAELQRSITDILSRNPALIQQMSQGTAGVNKLAETLLATLRAQTVELQKQQQVGAQVASILAKSGVRVKEGVPIATSGKPGKAAGYIPNFAGRVSKRDGFAETIAAYQAGYEPGPVSKVDGKVYNKAESVVKFPGAKDRGIVPPKDSPAGKQYQKDFKKTAGYDPYEYMDTGMAKGFIPNFAFYKKYEPSKENIEKGIIGEAKTAEELKKRVTSGQLSSFKQESAKDPYASFDFRAVLPTGEEILIDAKNLQKFGRSKYLGEVTKKLWNFKQFNDLQTQTLDYTKTPVEIFIPKNTYEKSKSLKGLQRERLFNEGLGALKGSGIKQYGSADRIKFKSRIKTFGEGFIPNFAQTKEPPIQLGNLDTIPNKLGKKVLSLIYPGISEGYVLRPATASYLKKQYTANIPVAGINQTRLKSQLPDIDKNIGNLLVKEANQFGQALGGFNFLRSPGELPNYGAAKGAVGVAFEGGVQTLLQQKVGKQNAGIDFRNVTPRLRSIFNNAPGVYDAKRSPELTNEVLQKLLNETKPGATVQKTSGKAGAAYLKERSAAVEQLRKEGVVGSVAIRQALKDRFGIVGKANGYIPNFAALQDAVGRERAAGIPSGKIYVAQDKRLAANGYNPFGLGVFNTRDEPNSGARSKAIKSRGYSSGYVPNFVQEDTAPTSLGSSFAAILTQLGFVAFALSGFATQFKQNLTETQKNLKGNAAIDRKALADKIKAERRQAIPAILGGQEARKTALAQAGSKFSSERAAAKSTVKVGGLDKFGAGISAGGVGLAIGAPIIAESIANAIGQETKNARIGSASASALGQVGTFAGTGALIAGPKGAAVGALIGALTGLSGVIKQLSTDIPELSAKARESASNLTQFNEASQKTKTAFEQLQGLRSQGQTVEAGKAEGVLLKNIQKDFAKSPELRAQATSAIINRDFAGLQQALDRNSEALLKTDISEQQNLTIQTFLEKTKNIGDDPTARYAGITAKTFAKSDIEVIRKSFEENIKPFSTLTDRKFDTGLTPDKNENRKLLNQAGQSLKSLYGELRLPFSTDPEKREKQQERRQGMKSRFLDLVQPGMDKAQKEAFLKMPDTDFITIVLNEYAEVIREGKKEWVLIDKNTGRFNKEVQNVLQNIGDVRSSFDSFAQSASFAVALQNDFNNALSAAKAALESAKLGNFGEIATQLGDTSAGRRYSTQAQMVGNQETRDNTINTAFSKIEQTLTDYLIQQAKKTQEGIRTTADTGGGEDPLKVAQKAQGEIRSSIETLIRQLTDVDFKAEDGDIDPLKSIESNLKTIFDKLKLPDEQKDELAQKLTPELQNLLRESVIANTLLKQQNALIAEQNVGQLMKEFITASQNALGGRERFASSNLTFLNPFQQAIGDLISLDKGAQGREVDIEKGRASLNLLDSISDIVGRNIIPSLGDDNPLRRVATEGLSMDIFDQLKSVFDEFQKLPKEKLGDLPTDLLKTLGQQVGLSGEDIDAQISSGSIDTLIDTIADRLAEIQVGGKVDDVALEGIRNSAIEQLLKEGSITPEMASNIKNGLAQSLSVETLMVGQLYEQTTLLSQILSKIPGDTKKNEDDNSTKSSPKSSNFNLNTPLPTIAKGFIPSFAKEMNSVRKGVGGAKGTDYPLFVPNLNGEGAWINSGEKLIPNFANTGKTAVLTRDMQKAMNMANGYIPKEKELQEALLRAAGVNSLIQKNLGLGFEQPLGAAGEIPKVELFDPNDPKNKGFRAFTEIYGRSAKVSFKGGESIGIGTIANEATALTQNELPAGITYPSKLDENIRQMREMGRAVGILGERGSIGDKDTLEKAQKAYRERLKIYADKIIALNENSVTPFAKTKTFNLTGMEDYDQRAFSVNDPNRGYIISEFRNSNSRDYSIERLSTLNSMLFEGLQNGSIKQEDLITQGFAKDKNEADYIIKEVGQISSLITGPQPKPSRLPAPPSISITPPIIDSSFPSQNLDTILNAERTIRNITEGTKTFGATGFDLTNFDPARIVDQYITNPEKLRLDDPDTFDIIEKSVKDYLKNPTKTLTGNLGTEIQKAFNAKDPESMQKWVTNLNLSEDAWDRIANKNGGWDKAINNKKLPMAIRMGLWNRQERTSSSGLTGTNIPRTGQVLTVGYVNGSEQNPLSYRDAAIEAGADFQADGRLRYPGRDMVREMNYVKPDGTVLTYKRVRGRPGQPMSLRLVSATRPPNQEYVTEGTSNDIIGVKNDNVTEYYSTADAPLGGLGEYKGKRIADNKGDAIIEDSEGNIVGSIKSWQDDPAVKKAIATGNISEIEKATTRARNTAYANRGEIYGTPSVIDTIVGTTPKNKASQDFDNFIFDQKNKKYIDGVAADLVEPKTPETTVTPPPPKKEITPQKIDEDIKKAKTKARGYIPSFAKEMSDIRKGVGGAIPTDTPVFVPNLNGEPAIVNSGEKLIPNFAGTGETAVLTREMQKMMTVAQGYLPPKAQKYNGMNLIDSIKARHGKEEEDRFSQGFIPNLFSRAELKKTPTKFSRAELKKTPTKFSRAELKTTPTKFSRAELKTTPTKFSRAELKTTPTKFSDERGLVDNAWQRIAKKYYDRNLLQSNMSFNEFLPLYAEANGLGPENGMGKGSESYLTTASVSRGGPQSRKLPMAIRMALFNRAASPYAESTSKFSGETARTGLGRGIPAKNYTNLTRNDGRTLSYVNGRLSSVTRPQNEQYVTEGTSDDVIGLQRNKNVTEYYRTQGSMLGGLGSYSGRRIEESIPLGRGPIKTQQENTSGLFKSKSFGLADFITRRLPIDTFQNKFMSQISDTVGYQKFLQDDPLKLTPEPQQNFVRKTFIEDSSGKTVGTGTDLSFDSEVRKAAATGNIYEIEKATRAARDRISPREERLSKMSPEDQDIFRQMYFKQDLADKAGGSAFVSPMYELTEQEYKQEQLYLQGRGKRPQIIAQKNQEAINMEDKYYKEMAEKSGMGDRFITDYIEPRERQIVREQQMKPIDESKRMLSRTDQFIKETDDYLMRNQPSEQYIKDREQFIQKPQSNISIPTPRIDEEEDKKRYARGFIPNFAVDPMAVTEAKMREKREAGPGSMPTFAMYNGKPMVYDARTQTPASAIRDHAFEGGYDGVVKRQFGAKNTTKKNLVANMSIKPQEMMSQSNVNNSPVFNINFNPQTTYSSQRNSDVPNFANITKKYDTMIEDMRGSLRTVWDRYNSLENITSSNIREGKLNSAPPRTKRLVKSIDIM